MTMDHYNQGELGGAKKAAHIMMHVDDVMKRRLIERAGGNESHVIAAVAKFATRDALLNMDYKDKAMLENALNHAIDHLGEARDTRERV